eukprot:g4354.t1
MYAKPKRRHKRLRRRRLYALAALTAFCCGGCTVVLTLRALLAADGDAVQGGTEGGEVGTVESAQGNNQHLRRGHRDYSRVNEASEPVFPCLIAKTTTAPAFRICTVDPEGAGSLDYGSPAYWSKLVHVSGSARLMSHWPLATLLRKRGGTNPTVIDVGASIGFFSLEAAMLGAQVTAIEREMPLVSLIKTSIQLNEHHQLKLKVTTTEPNSLSSRLRVVHTTAGDGEGNSAALDNILNDIAEITVLRIAASRDADRIIRGAHELLTGGRVHYIFLDFSPAKMHNQGEDALSLLKRLKNTYHFNVFADRTAEGGALLDTELQSLIKGVGKETRTLFLAQNEV